MIKLQELIDESKILNEGFWDNLKSKLGVGKPAAPASAAAPVAPVGRPSPETDAAIDAQFKMLDSAGIWNPVQRLKQFGILNPHLYTQYAYYYPNGKPGDGTHDAPVAATGSANTGSLNASSAIKIESVAKNELMQFKVIENKIEGTKIIGPKRTVMYNINNFSTVSGRIQTFVFNKAQKPSYIGNVTIINKIYNKEFKPMLSEGEYTKETLASEYIDIIGGVIADLTKDDSQNYNINKLPIAKYKQAVLQHLHDSSIINKTANTVIQTHINFINKFKTLKDVSPDYQKNFSKAFSVLITNGRTLTSPSIKEEPKTASVTPPKPTVKSAPVVKSKSKGKGTPVVSKGKVKSKGTPVVKSKSKGTSKAVAPKTLPPKASKTAPNIGFNKSKFKEGINEEYQDYRKYFV